VTLLMDDGFHGVNLERLRVRISGTGGVLLAQC
jgi:hypothetical protein